MSNELLAAQAEQVIAPAEIRSSTPAGQVLRWSLAAALLLAFGLRVHLLGAQALWADEASTVLGARNSLPDLIPYSLKDTFPPLHFMLLHLAMGLAGESEFATRFVSAFFGVLVVPAVFLIARRIGSNWAGLAAALLAAVAPYQVYFSQEVRGYAQLAALTALSTALFFRLSETRSAARRPLIGYWLTTAGAIYTQYLAVGPLAITWAAWGVLALRDRRQWRPLLAALGGVVVLFLPWVLLSVAWALGSDAGSPTPGVGNSPIAQLLMIFRAGAVEIGRLPLGEALLGTLVYLPLGETLPVASWLPLALVAWLVILLGAAPLGRRWPGRGGGLVLLLCLVLPVAAALLTALPTNRPHWSKYFIASSPALLALLALGITVLLRRVPNRTVALAVAAVALALVLIPVAPALANLYYAPAYFRSDFRPELARLRRMSPPTDAYIANPKEAFADLWYYYPGGLTYAQPPKPENVDALAQALAGKTGVWVIKNQPVDFDADGHIERWLTEHGYRAASWYPANMSFTYYALAEAPLIAGRDGVRFGDVLELAGSRLGVLPLQNRAVLEAELRWNVLKQPPDLTTYLLLVDSDGHPWAQRDLPAGGGFAPSSGWRPGSTVPDRVGLLLPPGMPAGQYQVLLGMYGGDGKRLPVSTGGDRLPLATVTVPAIPAARDDYDAPPRQPFQTPAGLLLNASLPEGTFQPGDRLPLTLDLLPAQTPANLTVRWLMDGPPLTSTLTIDSKPAGQLLHSVVWVNVPPRAAGNVRVEVGTEAAGLTAGTLPVAPRDRQTTPLQLEHPLQLSLGDGVVLAGYSVVTGACAPACAATLTLDWRAEASPLGYYKSFVHILDASGQIIAQRDQIPLAGHAPTPGWLAGEWLEDPQPAFSLPPGRYRIAVGLYDPDSGKRLVSPDGLDRHEIGELEVGAPAR